MASNPRPSVNTSLPEPRLCVADDATFWPWVNWPDFATYPNKDKTVVILPIAGLCDWGLGEALDAEEAVLTALIRETSLTRPKDLPILVLPPVRFVLGPTPKSAFAIDPDVAGQLLEEVLGSVAIAGFKKVTFLNASPWNEELCKAVGRDVRISRRLQMFCVHLSALGLDFSPSRGGGRTKVKQVLAAVKGIDGSLEAAAGRQVLSDTAARLASILGEMSAKAALANGGILETKTWP